MSSGPFCNEPLSPSVRETGTPSSVRRRRWMDSIKRTMTIDSAPTSPFHNKASAESVVNRLDEMEQLAFQARVLGAPFAEVIPVPSYGEPTVDANGRLQTKSTVAAKVSVPDEGQAPLPQRPGNEKKPQRGKVLPFPYVPKTTPKKKAKRPAAIVKPKEVQKLTVTVLPADAFPSAPLSLPFTLSPQSPSKPMKEVTTSLMTEATLPSTMLPTISSDATDAPRPVGNATAAASATAPANASVRVLFANEQDKQLTQSSTPERASSKGSKAASVHSLPSENTESLHQQTPQKETEEAAAHPASTATAVVPPQPVESLPEAQTIVTVVVSKTLPSLEVKQLSSVEEVKAASTKVESATNTAHFLVPVLPPSPPPPASSQAPVAKGRRNPPKGVRAHQSTFAQMPNPPCPPRTISMSDWTEEMLRPKVKEARPTAPSHTASTATPFLPTIYSMCERYGAVHPLPTAPKVKASQPAPPPLAAEATIAASAAPLLSKDTPQLPGALPLRLPSSAASAAAVAAAAPAVEGFSLGNWSVGLSHQTSDRFNAVRQSTAESPEAVSDALLPWAASYDTVRRQYTPSMDYPLRTATPFPRLTDSTYTFLPRRRSGTARPISRMMMSSVQSEVASSMVEF